MKRVTKVLRGKEAVAPSKKITTNHSGTDISTTSNRYIRRGAIHTNNVMHAWTCCREHLPPKEHIATESETFEH